MMHESRFSPSREARNSNLPARTPLLDLRHDAVASLAADRPSRAEEYEDQWELNFLSHIAREIYEEDPRGGRYEEEDGRQFAESKVSRARKKGLSKYKAYAVKMKIPSYHDLARPKPKEGIRNGDTLECKKRSQLRGIYEPLPRGIYEPMMEEVFRANVRDIAINIFEGSHGNIFKKRPGKPTKNAIIRKRSIRTTEKRKEDQEAKASLNKFLKTSTSPKIPKKCVISLDQSSLETFEVSRTSMKQPINLKKTETNKSKKGINFAKTPMRSPQKEKEAYDSTSKLLEKVERAIHFKKKEKSESPSKQPLKQSPDKEKEPEEKRESLLSGPQLAQASKTLIRTIYTSKDVIRNNKSNAPREQSRVQHVYIFNSEDNYIKRLLGRAGWIHNHDHRSHFYNLKWVFKPDAIDYSLKPAQFVNHVKNSHELTSKHYLNKNLKAYLTSWTNLYSVYPHSYDFAKPSERQDFYSHFRREVMMTLLQNIYEYMLALRRTKVESLTQFYVRLLESDGSYGSPSGESPLRKKHFRKIEMEDYRQHDNNFVVHMNLLVVALRYWRSLRKHQQLDLEDDSHFLAFKEKEFEENIAHLEKYSKKPVNYSSHHEQYFARQFFATPSEMAMERVVKEYVYFERQLGRQWRVFGRGNTWIVKPCSASRGTGIYLANDCSQILSDTRGIQSKIVQRYIQRPLILRNGPCRGRKFDLRQWVLLRGVQPLQIYMFSHCYLRVCSEDFVMGNIHNLKAHLTNYSFNKRHFHQPAHSVVDQDSFQALLLQERGIDFNATVRPKIADIVIRSIKSTQHLISDCGQACFSLLGYDVLLDDDCQPWLLEVNMSPACEERTEWLRTYLDVMGRELLKIVLPEDFMISPVQPVNRGSELPFKKDWQEEEYGQLQLKKMKTEVSQGNGEGNEDASYINTFFQLPSKVIPREEAEAPEDEEGSEEYGEKITYEDFLNANGIEKAGSQVELQEKEIEASLLCEDELDEGNYKSNLPPLTSQKFANLQLFLEEPNGRNQAESPNKSMSLSPVKSPCPMNASEISLMRLEAELKWERICFEEYLTKKDVETHFEATGCKISNSHIAVIDSTIAYCQDELRNATNSCIALQTAIRGYLTRQKQRKIPVPVASPSPSPPASPEKQKEKPCLKVNVSQLRQQEFRESKSALYNHEEKSWCLDRPPREGALSKLERPTTARNASNPTSAKNRSSDTFREKIRSIALQAATRENYREAQVSRGIQPSLEERAIAQQACSSQASLV